MPQIEFINVSKEYEPGKKVLDDVTFKVEPGEFMFVVGPSGAGKSTIIKLLTKEEMPEGGDILFNGESVLNISKDSVPGLRRKIGVVFQDFRLLESKTVFDNVAVALEVADSNLEEIRSIVPNVLNMVGLTDKMFKYPKQLSGGEKQKVAIARALAHEPDVILADEPTGMIDPDSVDDVLEVLEKINSLGTTILMATHDQEIVNAMKKRVLRIERGQVVSDKKGGKYRA
ncbi:cell division ATP-binding protein FtsE [candidate division WWE3 bacterium RIFOXYB1_FULL_43_24]|uniref:Cell division ATP-binding protein FtsE n=2 Tax=Katanobacteria TaxID=422282 RepID=A0A0G1AXP4_UNCKA|nr:MAG: Cell division ATP-binding protein FtsE [candidate division WWE3 bacterium GW2011_GWA1_42_12]KKS33574.1 MAG: Cell division ATP-binding protein FtsE [candidate division WWE3 bacterium GW2011_GWD1_42_14]KKS38871.1 MAG: Cell division ATP-binding protein FtsE [candidate division WWE3 bacterium GW2011_GWF1_42_14]KKS40569.1 MAG: Cell division ATP-binding protein FtsE [candidate division WWE3 bacterium GW2011_GWE1_42_16]KKS66923.1 MAG: Cell division ATP-binding protein FtsE [candidate division 